MVTLLALLGCTIVLVDVPCSVPPGIPPVDDTAATDCTERYPDADGDGYGDEDGATVICDAAGFSDTPGDCDDADPDVHPDALERCDGVSDACDPTWTSDDGIVTWTTADGFQDATADFAAGSDGDPAALTYDEGRVDVCAGTWFVNLTLDGARIVGTGDVVLDGGGAGPVVLVTSGENLLQGLTLTNGAGSEGGGLDTTGGSAQVDTCVITGNTAANGGGVAVHDGSDVELRATTIQANEATDSGGGLWVSGTAVLDGTELVENTARSGGGLAMSGGTLTGTEVSIRGNVASGDGGGVTGTSGRASVLSLTDSVVSTNDADAVGGVAAIDLTFTCTGSTSSDRLGIFANTSAEAKPPQMTVEGTSRVTAVDCDFANPATEEPGLVVLETGETLGFDVDADFVCTATAFE